MIGKMIQNQKCLSINEVLKNMNHSDMIERMNDDQKCLYIKEQVQKNMNTYVNKIGDVESLPDLDLGYKPIDEESILINLNESINLQIRLHPSVIALANKIMDKLYTILFCR